MFETHKFHGVIPEVENLYLARVVCRQRGRWADADRLVEWRTLCQACN